MRGKLYRSYVRSCMLRGGETWPVKKEKQVGIFLPAVMRMIGWMCGVKDVWRGSHVGRIVS